MDVGRIKDARDRLYTAKSYLKESDYPGTTLEAQICV